MIDSSGTIQARYDYDPYGVVTLLLGTNLSDFQYAGMYEHQTSGFNLTLFRAYSPQMGRWLSRDPIGEQGGLNLYGYCGESPNDYVDIDGLTDVIVTIVISNSADGSVATGTMTVSNGNQVVQSGVLTLPTNQGAPAGTYPATFRRDSGPGLNHQAIELQNVPDHQNIQVHPGNTRHDTQGCFLPGVVSGNTIAGGSSRPATAAINNLVTATQAADRAAGQQTTITVHIVHQ